MSQAPYTTVFDAQRALIENAGEAVTEGLRAQRDLVEATTAAVESSGSVATETNDLSREGWHTFLESVEASLPDDAADFEAFHEVVDRTHDATEESYDRTTDAAVEAAEGGENAYEAYLEATEAAVDSSVEAAIEGFDRVEETGR